MKPPRRRFCRIEVHGAVHKIEAPGLKIMKRTGESVREPYWIATVNAISRGFLPKTVRLADYLLDDLVSVLDMAERCRQLNAEMLSWLDDPENRSERKRPAYNGTVTSICTLYLDDPESKFQRLEESSQRTYRDGFKVVMSSVGTRRLDRVLPIDVVRWFSEWKRPAQERGPERLRRARSGLQMFRVALLHGALYEISDCRRLLDGMAGQKFESGTPREAVMTIEQAERFIDVAVGEGDIRLALGQAAQFELMLRQGDVIGKFKTIKEGQKPGPLDIVFGKKFWTGAFMFEKFQADGTLAIKTSKNSRRVSFDLQRYTLLQRCLGLIPQNERKGPCVIQQNGEPYRRRGYSKRWREIAERADIPREVWNMDGRASGVTEARDAGAQMSDVSRHAAHAGEETTRRIYDRASGVAVTGRVQDLRVAKRARSSK
jgi:integrase